MTYIALLLFGYLIALTFIMLASLWYIRWLMGKMVFSKQRDIEAIASSGTLPEAWSRKFERKMIRLREAGRHNSLKKVQSAARRSYLRKLSRLAGYVRRSRLIESEESRKYALRQLQMLDREWRSAQDESVS
ncbi:hypothetical protein SD70_12390 [Gordoniibacillus kamchatkensis]|uniref:Uncharacterized protein n=1 Tax=Gordoniibacillus kamchatkensis TaxID=1590651 RepID=A0ABR5AHQ6_9BACL|nr:hypothetical protein [Paenibacillus sp. VKM B-2647]KIL40549.1 hypothetical protein SD70_12390 [Paenibacillus sp. VKM B-2647]